MYEEATTDCSVGLSGQQIKNLFVYNYKKRLDEEDQRVVRQNSDGDR